ncbi:MAG: response regulator transcription factor [Candidatus Omnitrophota bacterium]
MTQKIAAVRTISYILALLYAVSGIYYLGGLGGMPIQNFSVLISTMCGILFAGAVALAVGKSWGRDLLVYGNIVFFVVGLWLLILFPNMARLYAFDEFIFTRSLFLGSLFLAIVLFAYFTQNQVKMMLHPEARYSWKSILVIDDDEGIQKTIKKILLSRGYSVLSAMNGEKGIQVAKLQKPDLIILDVILPGLKGRDVCARLKEDEETRHIPVIFLTAKGSQDDIQAEMQAGGAAHMTKPIKARALIAEIKALVNPSH